jgi:hypothetical protein
MPWCESDPLIFHSLTGIGYGHAANQRLAELVEADARLEPLARRSASWTGGPVASSGISRYDLAAGDDRFLFYGVGQPHYGEPNCPPREPVNVSLAFHLGDLLRHGVVGWRAHDLVGFYGLAERNARSRRRAMRQAREFADWATITEPRLVRRLVRYSAVHLRLAVVWWRDQRGEARLDERALARNRALARRAIAEWTQAHPEPTWWTRAEPMPPGIPLWDAAFASVNWRSPEIVCDGSVPLRAARYWQDGETGGWWPVRVPLGVQGVLPLGGGMLG